MSKTHDRSIAGSYSKIKFMNEKIKLKSNLWMKKSNSVLIFLPFGGRWAAQMATASPPKGDHSRLDPSSPDRQILLRCPQSFDSYCWCCRCLRCLGPYWSRELPMAQEVASAKWAARTLRAHRVGWTKPVGPPGNTHLKGTVRVHSKCMIIESFMKLEHPHCFFNVLM